MKSTEFKANRNKFLAIVLIVVVCQLLWEHFNGGVAVHYPLMRDDLPGISNWWALIILPATVWFASYRIQKRMFSSETLDQQFAKRFRNAVIGFSAMLIIGLVQSIAFTYGFGELMKIIALGVMFFALFIPMYRVEFILGYVLGTMFVFGPAIPFIGVLMFLVISTISHKLIKPTFKYLVGQKASNH